MPALASLLMVGVIWLTAVVLKTDVAHGLRLVCKVFIGGMTYLGFVWLLAPITLKNLADAVSQAFRSSVFLADATTTI